MIDTDKITDPVAPTAPIEVDTTPMVEKDDDLHPISRLLRKQLAEIDEKVTMNYTLADAIREGASVSKKLDGGFITEDSACALGAAYLAAKARGFI